MAAYCVEEYLKLLLGVAPPGDVHPVVEDDEKPGKHAYVGYVAGFHGGREVRLGSGYPVVAGYHLDDGGAAPGGLLLPVEGDVYEAVFRHAVRFAVHGLLAVVARA